MRSRSGCWPTPRQGEVSARRRGIGRRGVPARLHTTRRTHYGISGIHCRKPGIRAGGTWYYPREQFQYDATGLATVQMTGNGLTRNGERIDSRAMTAAHQTLQLPSVARVTNLENGLQVLVRINDRGPVMPARMLAVSPRVAELLAFQGGVARVRVQVEEGPSLVLREQMGGGPRLALAAAPRTAVASEALAPPPGIRQSSRATRAGADHRRARSRGNRSGGPDQLAGSRGARSSRAGGRSFCGRDHSVK